MNYCTDNRTDDKRPNEAVVVKMNSLMEKTNTVQYIDFAFPLTGAGVHSRSSRKSQGTGSYSASSCTTF